MADIEKLFDELRNFQSSNAIAEFLTEMGVKGELQDGDSCVISNWILTNSDAIGVSTTEEKIVVEDDQNKLWEFVNTPIVKEFIVEFDNYKYPNLAIMYDEYGEPDYGYDSEW